MSILLRKNVGEPKWDSSIPAVYRRVRIPSHPRVAAALRRFYSENLSSIRLFHAGIFPFFMKEGVRDTIFYCNFEIQRQSLGPVIKSLTVEEMKRTAGDWKASWFTPFVHEIAHLAHHGLSEAARRLFPLQFDLIKRLRSQESQNYLNAVTFAQTIYESYWTEMLANAEAGSEFKPMGQCIFDSCDMKIHIYRSRFPRESRRNHIAKIWSHAQLRNWVRWWGRLSLEERIAVSKSDWVDKSVRFKRDALSFLLTPGKMAVSFIRVGWRVLTGAKSDRLTAMRYPVEFNGDKV